MLAKLSNVQVFRLVEVKHKMTSHFYLTRIMPIGLFMALTLFFGNVVYLYLSVSFIQMLKVSGHGSPNYCPLQAACDWGVACQRMSTAPAERPTVCPGRLPAPVSYRCLPGCHPWLMFPAGWLDVQMWVPHHPHPAAMCTVPTLHTSIMQGA